MGPDGDYIRGDHDPHPLTGMIGGAEILRRRIEQRRIMAESNVEKVEVFQGNGAPDDHQMDDLDSEKWYWHARAGNGEIVANSAPESYTRREDAERAAEATFPSATMSTTETINHPTEEEEAVAQEEAQAAADEAEATEGGDDDATS